MAVPKKKTSVSRKGKRHAGQHHKLYTNEMVEVEKVTGEFTLRHHVSPSGYYKGVKLWETRADRRAAKAEAAASEES